jgi:nucleoside-diphosphate-sugar epimerase
MRVLLAGGTGVIGRRIIPLLVAQGHDVTALTRRAASSALIEGLGARPIVADVYEPAALDAAMRLARPDTVMHQLTDLGAGDRLANAKIRRIGTRHLVNSALAAGVTRMIAQSIAWAYEPGDRPATEDTPLDLASTGDRLDTVAGIATLENAVNELPEAVILRYGIFYGPDTWYAPDALMAETARAGGLTATADVTSFVHVDDAAAAAMAALTWAPGAVNVCDDEPASAGEWMPLFCSVAGAGTPENSGTRTAWARGADNRVLRHDRGFTLRYPTWRTGFLAG